MKDRYAYPAFFCYNLPGQVGVVFPDLPGCVSQGDNDEDALRMAKEALSLHLFGMEEDGDNIPEPTPMLNLKPEKSQATVLIDVWMPPIRESINNKAMNKTVTIPQWLLVEAKAADINFSQVLQDALMDRLGIHREIKRRKSPKAKANPAVKTAAD